MSPVKVDAPAISVVMPVYNGQRFLAEAIDSILSQTFGDFEFIIVDDGSIDRTPDILEKYSRQDARVRVHRQANGGVTAALNQAIRLSRGVLIARMDADDVSLPHRFQTQVAYLNAHPEVAVVGSWFVPIDDRGVRGKLHTYPTQPALLAWSMIFSNSLAHPTVMMRRDAINPCAAYSANYRNAEDYDLFLRLSRTTQLSNIGEPLLLYRTWHGNVSRQVEQAGRVLQDVLAPLGVGISEAEAIALHGLARDRYPNAADQAQRLSVIISELRHHYTTAAAGSDSDVQAINNDAAVRLWLLSAVSLRRSPRLAFRLARTASTLAPLSFVRFSAKVARAVRQRILRRQPQWLRGRQ